MLKDELQGHYQNFIQQELTIHGKTDPASPDTGVVSQRLDAVNALWDRLASQLGDREASLKEVLAASRQFHDTVKTLVEWLPLAADSVDAFCELDAAEQYQQFQVFVKH